LLPEECYWSELNEAPSGTREGSRGGLTDIIGDSPFTQQQLKSVEFILKVADEQVWLLGRGHEGRFVRVEGQLDVVRG